MSGAKAITGRNIYGEKLGILERAASAVATAPGGKLATKSAEGLGKLAKLAADGAGAATRWAGDLLGLGKQADVFGDLAKNADFAKVPAPVKGADAPLTTGQHSKKLRENLEADGRAPLPDEDASHIVASGHRRHEEARGILDRAGVDVDDAVNGGGLPSNKQVPNPHGKTRHNETHTNSKLDKVTEMLRQAELDGTVKETLEAIENQRQNGTF